jgi:predicted aspartyl protease
LFQATLVSHSHRSWFARWAVSAARFAAICALTQSFIACGVRPGADLRPTFLAGRSSQVVAIRDPLWGPSFEVYATLFGYDGRSASLWMTVDSGAGDVVVPEERAGEIGLRPRRSTHYASDGPPILQAASVARLTTGDLVASEVPIFVLKRSTPAKDRGILGQTILGASPWEVDWDRGTLTLGAVPWRRDDATTVVPLRRSARYAHDEVTVQINGHPVQMILDTGAVATTIPIDLARELGLSPRAPQPSDLAAQITLGGIDGQMAIDQTCTADLTIGALTLPAQPLMSLRQEFPAVLALDILGRFNLQVIPGERLQLRPRDDLRRTARARVGRWPGLGACASPACTEATIAAVGPKARIDLRFEAAIAGPVEILLACATPPATPEIFPSMDQLLLRGRPPAPYRHVAVNLSAIEPGEITIDTLSAANLWFAPDGGGCRTLTVLDLHPAVAADTAALGPDFAAIIP